MNPPRLRRLCAAALMAVSGSTMAAPEASPAKTLAVMSLVGDALDVVTFQHQTGQMVEANTHERIPTAGAKLDIVVLQAAGEAAQAAEPQTGIELLALSRPELFLDQEKWFDGDHAALPGEIAAALARDHAGRLLLVTKCRAPARIATTGGQKGTGHLTGLGFYVDNEATQRKARTGAFVGGLVAPFAYVDVRLIDVASGTVLRRERVDSASALPAVQDPGAANPWNALTPEEKMQAMRQLLDSELRTTVSALFAGSAATPVR